MLCRHSENKNWKETESAKAGAPLVCTKASPGSAPLHLLRACQGLPNGSPARARPPTGWERRTARRRRVPGRVSARPLQTRAVKTGAGRGAPVTPIQPREIPGPGGSGTPRSWPARRPRVSAGRRGAPHTCPGPAAAPALAPSLPPQPGGPSPQSARAPRASPMGKCRRRSLSRSRRSARPPPPRPSAPGSRPPETPARGGAGAAGTGAAGGGGGGYRRD